MRLGIVGLPGCGKTTVFNALTGLSLPTGAHAASGKLDVAVGVVNVPDARVDRLGAMYRPRKTTYATVTFTDIGGLGSGARASTITGPLRNELAKVDGFVHVVQAFADASGDARRLEHELILLDMVIVEYRLERLAAEWARGRGDTRQRSEAETALMERLRAHLDGERPLRELEGLAAAERKVIGGYGLLSLKPMLVLSNLADDAEESLADDLLPPARGRVCSAVRGRVEAEIAQLEHSERQAFLEAYGIEETGAARVIQLAYRLVGLSSFFTVGEDEVRAWTVRVGATALEAAAAIHTDLAKGFIRAEVTAYDELIGLGGPKAARAAGKQRLEGRDYVVQDGDVLTIRSGL